MDVANSKRSCARAGSDNFETSANGSSNNITQVSNGMPKAEEIPFTIGFPGLSAGGIDGGRQKCSVEQGFPMPRDRRAGAHGRHFNGTQKIDMQGGRHHERIGVGRHHGDAGPLGLEAAEAQEPREIMMPSLGVVGACMFTTPKAGFDEVLLQSTHLTSIFLCTRMGDAL